MIAFNEKPVIGTEITYIKDAINNKGLSGDGFYTKKCQNWFNSFLKCKSSLLTPSCTHALEMAAILIDIKPGDEVILPSYTFVSTANAFVLRGAKIIFVDIRKDTMNIDEEKIEDAVSEKTKAIVVVHYAGVACEMDKIMDIANRQSLYVIEDAAQGMMSSYKGRKLGTIGHLGTYSFHETKNYTSGGEGGLLIINDEEFMERAEIIREKGTNRSKFFRGVVDKYSWVDIGSSYLPSEIQSAYLYGQLIDFHIINNHRLMLWETYNENLKSFNICSDSLPKIPDYVQHNAHMFYIKLHNIEQRSEFIDYMKKNNVSCVFHYIPLHSSSYGMKVGVFSGEDQYTTVESEKLVRLPLHYQMSSSDVELICNLVKNFYEV